MNKFKRLLLIIPISLITGTALEAQTAIGIKDSLTRIEQKEIERNNREKSQAIENNTGVKQIRSARPALSRASGARPPSVVRPSGSGIPKGIGKPGGARGAGRR